VADARFAPPALLTQDFVVSKLACFHSSAEREVEVDKVAGFLEVGRTEDARQIVIRLPELKPDATGAARIVLSPRYARHLANLLIEHAAFAEEDVGGALSRSEHLPQQHREPSGPR
jgi:hypothetical protein